MLVDTQLVRDVGGFDTSLASLADWDCWLRLAQESPLARVGQTDVGYRINAGGMAHDVSRQEAELQRMTEKYAALPRPLQLRVAAPYRAYLARLEYRAGHRSAGWARTWRLVTQERRASALLMLLRELSPLRVQRLVRRRQLAGLARRRPYQDWSWVLRYVGSPGGRRA